jgi:hydroxymethylpyrimidine/phosphomethylpyrimidine kinase
MKNKNNSKQNFYPAALNLAGSDSSGGAGVQVDLRTFNAFAVYGCSAITAITAQNPKKITDIQAVNSDVVASQIDRVLAEIPVKYAKSGMLFNADIVKAVAEKVAKYQIQLVVDPVMTAACGEILLENSAFEVMKKDLLPLAKVITPNIAEAELLSGKKINNEKDLISVALDLAKTYKTDVVLKGANFVNMVDATDIVVLDGDVYRLKSPYLKNCRHSHGAGCTFSAAICANLALGTPLDDSILEAKTFVFGSLAEPVRTGNTCEVMYPPELDYSEHVSLIGI